MSVSPTRQRCTGVDYTHAPAFLSIAKARELLRCPVCGREVVLTGGDRR